ncbi:hypothetical protein LguiB_028362 [Lonicera macranthoides]
MAIELISTLCVSSTCSSLSCLAPLEAALFDIDGTLCYSYPVHFDALCEMLQVIFSGRGNVCRAWQRKLVTQVRALNWLDSEFDDWFLYLEPVGDFGVIGAGVKPKQVDAAPSLGWEGRVRKSSEHVGIRAKAYRDTETSKSASNAQRSRGVKKRGTRQRFWLSEVTTLIEPIEDRQNLEPGFLKWNISQLTPLLLNADFNALELREAPEETQGEDPIDAPETRIPKQKGKRSTLSKRQSSVHKRIKTENQNFQTIQTTRPPHMQQHPLMRQVETGPSDLTGEELADTPQETSPSNVHINDPHIVKNPHAETAMAEKEQVENHDESIGDEKIVHHTKSYKVTPAGTSSPHGKIDEQSELIIQEPTLLSENQIGNELHNTDEDEEPKIPVDSDSDGLATYDVTEGMPLQCIGWRPAYDIAYVKRLEFDRANLNSRDLQHSQLVKSYKFQMESSHDYHRSIERTNEVHELRIERLTRKLRRERANNERIQQENISLWRRLVSLQIEVASKECELAKTHFENKTTSANDPTIPSFEILS